MSAFPSPRLLLPTSATPARPSNPESRHVTRRRTVLPGKNPGSRAVAAIAIVSSSTKRTLKKISSDRFYDRTISSRACQCVFAKVLSSGQTLLRASSYCYVFVLSAVSVGRGCWLRITECFVAIVLELDIVEIVEVASERRCSFWTCYWGGCFIVSGQYRSNF